MGLKLGGDILVSAFIIGTVFLVDGFLFPDLFNARSSFFNLISYFLAGLTFLLAGGWAAYLIHKYSWRARMKKYFDEL